MAAFRKINGPLRVVRAAQRLLSAIQAYVWSWPYWDICSRPNSRPTRCLPKRAALSRPIRLVIRCPGSRIRAWISNAVEIAAEIGDQFGQRPAGAT